MKTIKIIAAFVLCLAVAGCEKAADPDYAKKPSIKWNFTKFLVGKDGRVIRRFEPTAPLADVEKAIVDAMQAK